MRYFSLGMNEFSIWLDLSVLVIFSFILIILGGYAFRKS